MNSHPLPQLFTAVVALSWRAGWLIAVLAALRLAVRGRVPAQVWFAAWIVVALRLLLPFSIPAGWSPYNWSPTQPPAAAAAPPEAQPAANPRAKSAPIATEPAAMGRLAPAVAVDAAPVSFPVGFQAWTPKEVLAAIWLAGAFAFAAARMAGSWGFRRRLKSARPPSDPRVATLVGQEAGAMRAGARIRLLETDAVDAPALYGLLRPRLLLPIGLAAKLTEDELRHVVRHELGHWRRRDLPAQALLQAAVTIHWFNPLAWLAARLARTDCELACDEFVLRREPAGAGAYGATLLKVLGVVGGRRRPVAAIAMLEGREQLAQRIRMIAGYRTSTAGRSVAGVMLVAALAAASATRESFADEKPAIPGEPGTLNPAPAPLPAQPSPFVANDNSGEAVERQRLKVEQLTHAIQSYREKNNLVALDQRMDMLNDTLKAINLEQVSSEQELNVAETRLDQVKEFRKNGAVLTNLSFIASRPLIARLTEQLATLRITKAQLGQKYAERHPQMIQKANSIAEAEEELAKAIDVACAQIESDFQAAKRNHEQVQMEFEKANRESFELNRIKLEYENLRRELNINEQLLQRLGDRARKSEIVNSTVATHAAPNVGSLLSPNSASNVSDANSKRALPYRIIAYDLLGVHVFQEPDLGRTVRVDAEGNITLPLVGPVYVSGMTLPEAQANVEQAYRDGRFFWHPQVSLTVEETARRRVSVQGYVKQPGAYDLSAETATTLMDMIAKAGGFAETAKGTAVKVTRILLDGTTKLFVVDADDVMTGKEKDKAKIEQANMVLEPGDIIYVPERTI